MKGLLLFYEPYALGVRDSEKTFNLDIIQVKVTVDSTPNKVNERYIWDEVFRKFGKEKSLMTTADFYAGDRFTLFVDLGA